ncbi:MAG: hypothetical protein K2H86_04265 [Muribaculaceae bacterium]|nr:hypothetical protein [Muribaculaceae bacterium]
MGKVNGMIRSILRKLGITHFVRRRLLLGRINRERRNESNLITSGIPSSYFEPLTPGERNQIIELWGGIDEIKDINFREFEMFKRMNGFDARYLTHDIYLPVIARLLNDYRYTTIFDDKGLAGYIKPTHIRFPYCYARRINSDYYDNEMRQIPLEKVLELCIHQNAIFIKPSKNTSGGHGAKLIRFGQYPISERERILLEEINRRNYDYVIQECINQHPVMAQFNPSSVNTLRITTLMLNGRYSLCSVILRCGKEGLHVDNWGAGGLLVPVTSDGKVTETGLDNRLNQYTSSGKCVFEKCQIPQLPEILKLVERCHREDFAICKLIGWDITIDSTGNPVIIELNSSQPGVIGEQLLQQPIFGDRTQEVIEYCKSKIFSY